MTDPEPAEAIPERKGRVPNAYADDALRAWAKKTPGADYDRAAARLDDLLKPIDRALTLLEWDQLVDQVKQEMGPTAPAEPCGDLDAALGVLRRVVKTKDPNGPLLILVTAAQDHVIELLDSTVLLAFKGRSGAGKGTALESAVLLTRRGQVLSVTTPADLSAALEEGRAIGIPEADSLFHKDPIVAKILRDGYRRGNEYGFMVPVNGKEWKRETRSLFGFKIFDFHVSFDPHVLGRSIVLEMEPDDSVDLSMDAEKKARHLAPVRSFLIHESERVKREWTREKVDALWDSPEFRAAVKSLGGKVGRDHVCGADLLLVSRLFGWDLTKELRKAIRGRRTLDELSDESEVADAIRELAQPDGKSIQSSFELRTEDVLEHINARRTKLRVRTLTPMGLGSLLGDLGFKRGVDWLKATSGPNRNKAVLLPARFLRESEQAEQPEQKVLDGAGSREEESDSGPSAPAAPAAPEVPVAVAAAPVVEEAENWTVPPKERANRPPGSDP
ncbi:MAG: hypothetical protein ACLPP2_07790 [Thermoplasmata archaeon]